MALLSALLLYLGTKAKASILMRSLIPIVSHVPSCVEKQMVHNPFSFKFCVEILSLNTLFFTENSHTADKQCFTFREGEIVNVVSVPERSDSCAFREKRSVFITSQP